MRTSEPEAREARVRAGDVELEGTLTLGAGRSGLVLFAHGSGSSRHSPRNRYVADVLHRAGLGTLLFDLLTREEDREDALTRRPRFDIERLAQRVVGALDWIASEPAARGRKLGLFGASTGAAAALVAAARRPASVSAVVSRGGRPDLAREWLREVRAPTLLVVGSLDEAVIELNRAAQRELTSTASWLELVPGASHLFEEPGALAEVAQLAAEFFRAHLGADRSVVAHPSR